MATIILGLIGVAIIVGYFFYILHEINMHLMIIAMCMDKLAYGEEHEKDE